MADDPLREIWRRVFRFPVLAMAGIPGSRAVPFSAWRDWMEEISALAGFGAWGVYGPHPRGGWFRTDGRGDCPVRVPPAAAAGPAEAVLRAWPGADGAWPLPAGDGPPDTALAAGYAPGAPGLGWDPAERRALGEALAAQAGVWRMAVDRGGRAPGHRVARLENDLCRQFLARLAPAPASRATFPFRAGWHVWRLAEARGDFLDLLPGRGGRLWFMAGEASGRGAETAGDIAHLMLRARGDWARRFPLADAVRHLNRHLFREGRRGRLVSLCMGEADPRSRVLRLARQGGTAVLVRSPSGSWSAAGAGDETPLGLRPDLPVTETAHPWDPGAALLCATDGLSDHAWRDGRPFGRSDWLDLLAEPPAGAEAVPDAPAPAGGPFAPSATSAGSVAGLVAARTGRVTGGRPPLDELTLFSLER